MDVDAIFREFEAEQRPSSDSTNRASSGTMKSISAGLRRSVRTTTMLCGGLTMAQDFLISGALEGIGYRVVPLDAGQRRPRRLAAKSSATAVATDVLHGRQPDQAPALSARCEADPDQRNRRALPV